jgi:hypothetical protein
MEDGNSHKRAFEKYAHSRRKYAYSNVAAEKL